MEHYSTISHHGVRVSCLQPSVDTVLWCKACLRCWGQEAWNHCWRVRLKVLATSTHRLRVSGCGSEILYLPSIAKQHFNWWCAGTICRRLCISQYIMISKRDQRSLSCSQIRWVRSRLHRILWRASSESHHHILSRQEQVLACTHSLDSYSHLCGRMESTLPCKTSLGSKSSRKLFFTQMAMRNKGNRNSHHTQQYLDYKLCQVYEGHGYLR